MITITSVPRQSKIEFGAPCDAIAWLVAYKNSAIADEELHIDSLVTLSAYAEHVPPWVAAWLEVLESRQEQQLVPKIHWIVNYSKEYSTGHTYYKRHYAQCDRIAVTAGTNESDAKGVFLHEISHALTPGHHHDHDFYLAFFKLLYEFMTTDEIDVVMAREFHYRKSSKYWYAEFREDWKTLSKYHTAHCSYCGQYSYREHFIDCKRPIPRTENDLVMEIMFGKDLANAVRENR